MDAVKMQRHNSRNCGCNSGLSCNLNLHLVLNMHDFNMLITFADIAGKFENFYYFFKEISV